MDNIQNELVKEFMDIDDAYEAYAQKKGLNYLSLLVLEEIYESEDGITQIEISRKMHYPKQSVNLVVKDFLEKGYVVLKEVKENRKNKMVMFSKKGRKYAESILLPMYQKEDLVLSEFTKEERETLMSLLKKYSVSYVEKISDLK